MHDSEIILVAKDYNALFLLTDGRHPMSTPMPRFALGFKHFFSLMTGISGKTPAGRHDCRLTSVAHVKPALAGCKTGNPQRDHPLVGEREADQLRPPPNLSTQPGAMLPAWLSSNLTDSPNRRFWQPLFSIRRCRCPVRWLSFEAARFYRHANSA